MDEQDKAEMLLELQTELGTTEAELGILTIKLNNAIRDVIRAINFPAYYTNTQKSAYLTQYYGNIHDLTIYDYNQAGAEGETSHNENGTNRSWKSRKDCFHGIIAFANGLI